MSNSTRERIYLAAMLHDIGKFYQRADTGNVRSSNYLKEHCKEEATFCPVYNGVYSHKHVLWTAQFIDDYNSAFKQLVDSVTKNIPCKDSLVSLAASHHLSADALSDLGRIIKEADCLSSGMDRDTSLAFKDEQAEASWDVFKKTRMTSILETVGFDERGLNEREQNCRRLPLYAINLSKETFATEKRQEVDYKTLWEAFNAEFNRHRAQGYRYR